MTDVLETHHVSLQLRLRPGLFGFGPATLRPATNKPSGSAACTLTSNQQHFFSLRKCVHPVGEAPEPLAADFLGGYCEMPCFSADSATSASAAPRFSNFSAAAQ